MPILRMGNELVTLKHLQSQINFTDVANEPPYKHPAIHPFPQR
jgi:hypothetical protein